MEEGAGSGAGCFRVDSRSVHLLFAVAMDFDPESVFVSLSTFPKLLFGFIISKSKYMHSTLHACMASSKHRVNVVCHIAITCLRVYGFVFFEVMLMILVLSTDA